MRTSREEVEWNRKLPSITITLHSFTDEAKDSQEAHFVHKDGCGDDLKVVVDEAMVDEKGWQSLSSD